MDRYARGGFNVGYETRVDVRQLRAKRIAEAHEERRKAELDALLVWKDENQRYLTDLRPQLIHGKTTALNGVLLGSIRRECLDHVIVVGEAHLRRILQTYAGYYNEIRTHRSLDKDAPVYRPVQRIRSINSHAILGGLHHHYVRV